MSLKKQSIQGVIWTGIQQFGSQGISFIVSILLARLLTPSEFGLVAMILVFISISETILDSGLSQSLIRTVDPDTSDYSTVFYFNLVVSLLLYGILYLSAPFISMFYEQPALTELLRVLGLILIVKAFSIVQLTKLTKEMNFKLQTIISLPALLSSALVAVIMAFNGFGVWSLVAYRLIREILNSSLLWIYSKWKPKLLFSILKFKYHFKFGVNLLFSGILNGVFNNLYALIIGKYFSAAQLGYFNRANNLKQLPVQNLGNILNKVTYPIFSKINNNDQKLRKAYLKVIGLSIFVMSPIMIFMGVLAKPLILFLLTDKWIEVVPYLQILVIDGLLFPIHSFNLNILKVKGRSDLFLRLEIIKKIIIVLAVLFAMNYGVIGLVWSIVGTSIVALVINTYYSGKLINLTIAYQLKKIIPSILIGVCCGGLVFVTSEWLKESYHVVNLLVSTMIGSVSYIMLAHITKNTDYIELKKIILKR